MVMIDNSNTSNANNENELLYKKIEYFCDMCHELKTPINVIVSAVQLIELYMDKGSIIDDSGKLEKYLLIIKENGYKMAKNINNIIDVNKIDLGFFDMNIENCNIVELVKNTTSLIFDTVESKSIELIFNTEVKEKIIACDIEKIQRALLNILSNAVKFTNSNGAILVTIKDENDKVIISIKDTGIGISKENQQKIFERYTQIKDSKSTDSTGSGIGLSIVKSIIEAHKGHIFVMSEKGNGSEFIIELPAESLADNKISNG